MSEMTLEQVRQGEQDMRDGEALRLLVEAAADGGLDLVINYDPDDLAVWMVRIDGTEFDGLGEHIADAADACRAALAPDGARVTAP